MDDLISRQAALAIKVLPKCYRCYKAESFDEAYEHGWQDAMFAINTLPTIEPMHGRWINAKPKSKKVGKVCSSCGNEAYWDTDYGQQLFDYCPWCGARMDG